MSTSLLNLEGIIDLNALFTLNYNFDYLKMIIEALIHANRATNEKIKEFQFKLEEKDNKINELENKINTINNNLILTRKGTNKSDNNEKKNEGEEFNQEDEDIKKRLNYLEFKVNSIYNMSQDLEEIKNKLKKHEDNLILNNSSIEEIFEKLKHLNKQGEKYENEIYGLTVKINELYQSYKNFEKQTSKDDNGVNADEFIVLLNNLEKKINLKFVNQDEINQDHNDQYNKIKSEYENLKPQVDKNTKNINNILEQIEIIFSRLNDLKNQINVSNDLMNNDINDKLNNLKNYINEKLDEFTTLIDHLRETFYNQPHDGNNQFSDNDNKLLKDLLKRFSDLEKSFKNFSANINIEQILRELDKVNLALNGKASLNDFSLLKSGHDDLVIEVNQLKKNLNNLLNDKTIEDELIWLKKKFESLNNQIHNFKNMGDDNKNNQNKNSGNVDFSRFVELQLFLDFKNHTNGEIKALNDRLDELRRLIEDLNNLLNDKVSIYDFKNFEDLIILKLEELKNACNKKFADKNETAKNLKYLDGQIKNILEIYIKNQEKGDNWLLAKKPFGGHSCASCETYIGDLHDNSQPIHWNKYPMRDPNDKLYRVGSGFSKMLQMLNFDNPNQNPGNTPQEININYRPPQTANNFYRPNQQNNQNSNNEEKIKNGIYLPKVNKSNLRRNNLNMSSDNMENEEINEIDDGMQPKVVKIYRKIKEKRDPKEN